MSIRQLVRNFSTKSMDKLVKLIYLSTGQIDRAQLMEACECLNAAGVIAIPTDTIYGIAARVDNSNALDKIYQIKGRDKNKPLAVCVSNVDCIDQVADTSHLDKRIITSLLPGPVTILLKRSKNLNPDLNPGTPTVGVRVPDHNFIVGLSHFVGPLALTSANKSGEPSPSLVGDFESLWPQLDRVYDQGLCCRQVSPNQKPDRIGSTVIDLSRDDKRFVVVREGCAYNRTINTLGLYGYRKIKS